MRIIKIICLSLLVSLFAVSCKDAAKGGKDASVESVKKADLKNIEVGIEGMTCQIGCAKTIESKLSKMEGITSVSISFEDKIGKISYDANTVSEQKITEKITSIAGGETYTVTTIKEIASSCCAKDVKTCAMKCSDDCTEKDCEKCAAAKKDCKTKCESKQQAHCDAKAKKTCEKKCNESCTTTDCEKCAIIQKECKTKCTTKTVACCSKDLKTCTMKCEEACIIVDCEKCATVQEECKTKCVTEKQTCCTSKSC